MYYDYSSITKQENRCGCRPASDWGAHFGAVFLPPSEHAIEAGCCKPSKIVGALQRNVGIGVALLGGALAPSTKYYTPDKNQSNNKAML